jgi:hypothetical protein
LAQSILSFDQPIDVTQNSFKFEICSHLKVTCFLEELSCSFAMAKSATNVNDPDQTEGIFPSVHSEITAVSHLQHSELEECGSPRPWRELLLVIFVVSIIGKISDVSPNRLY